MTRGCVLILLCSSAPMLTACVTATATSGSMRAQLTMPVAAPAVTEIRVSPVAMLRSGTRADAASVQLEPSLTFGDNAVARMRLRATAVWTGRGAAHPSLSASVDEGETRVSELMGDTIAPGPSAALVHAQALHLEGGVRVERGARLRLDARLAAERTGGTGASADLLLRVATVRLDAGARYRFTRRVAFEATSRTSRERTGVSEALSVIRLNSAVEARLSASSAVTGWIGLVESVGAMTPGRLPSFGIGASYGSPTSGFRLAAVLARAAEVDRLDGSLRERIRTRVHVETPVVPGVSFGGTLQSASDMQGIPQRVVRSADATLGVDLWRGRRIEIGVARFQQYSGGVKTNGETRAVVQFTLAPVR